MIYKKGDRGLVPQFINYRLGLSGDIFTEETRQRVLQFQASYRNLPTDTTIIDEFDNGKFVESEDKLPGPYEQYEKTLDPTIQSRKNLYPLDSDGNINLELFPNGVVDIQTMTALSDIEIEEFNERLLTQTQETLSMTEYSNNTPLIPTGLYDIPTKNAIRNFQRKYKIGQQKIPIIENKNILPNIKTFWKNQSYLYQNDLMVWTSNSKSYLYNFLSGVNGNRIELISDNTCLLSDFIPIEVNNHYYVSTYGDTKNDYYIKILFFKNPTIDPDNSMITSLSTKKEDVCGFDKWVSTDTSIKTVSGEIPTNSYLPDGLNTPYTIRYIRVEIRRRDGGIIVPSDIENLEIQIEKGNSGTDYEPNSLTPSNTYYSGYLNIPTYSKIKSVYKLQEGVF